MDHLKSLTSQQLAMAGAGSLLAAGIMLANANSFGYLFLTLSAACWVGAFAKYRAR